ncbi:cytochrome P450 [Mycena vulgaris]|nr:cytochrome P450 [Mycena vulgaris]
MLLLFAAPFAAWLIVRSFRKHRFLFSAASRAFGGCPNAGVLWLRPFRTFSILLGSWIPFPPQTGSYFAKFTPYARDGSTCIGSVTLWGAIPTLWVSDAQAIKTIATETAIFRKDVEAYETVSIYGPNLIGTEGADWKRHRRVANPAFDEASNAFVWMETVRVVNEWFAELETKLSSDSSIILNTVEDLVQVTLLVVTSAGFGRRVSWQEDSSTKSPLRETLPFQEAVTTAVSRLLVRAVTPNWMYALSARVHIPLVGKILAETRFSFDAVRFHMLDLISLSRSWVVGGKVSNMDAGLLRNLVEANMTQADDIHHKKLTDDELLSDVFAFLLAGHETSSHALSFAVALLALYPDVQQTIYEESLRIWPDGCPTTVSPSSYKECMPKLQYTVATFQETVRLFPPVPRISKIVHVNTTLPAHRFTSTRPGEIEDIKPFSVPVPEGSIIMVDIMALHLNPIYWGRDAEDFKPERFIDTETYRWPRDAFFGFASGPRSCIGQRFAYTENVCVLASLVRSYEIFVPDHLRAKPFEDQKRLLLKWKPGLTTTPTDCVVRLRRRVPVA